MKNLSRWTAVMMCVAVVVGGITAGWAGQEQAKTSGAVFEKFDRALRAAERKQPAEKAREEMVRQRRIILNDDGDSQTTRNHPEVAKGAAAFLDTRFNAVVGTQVDTYMWCVGDGQTPPYSNKYGTRPAEAIGDANQVMVEAAHKADIEIFASLRMNDIHDGYTGLHDPLKMERPDLLIGEQFWPDAYPYLLTDEKPQAAGGYPEGALLRFFWSGYNYAEPEVRQHRLDFIEKTCRQYDFDGFELDYFRHPLFFKPGEEEDNLETMSEFVRQVRQLVNQIGEERGRPYVLAIRVPDTPEMALRTGLDIEQWLKEGLLDMLVIGGGYMSYAGRLKELIDMAHRYGVPAYPCINHFQDPIKMRSYASNFWSLGGDGVYVFNFAGVSEGSDNQACLNQMGDPDILLGLDKEYLPDNGCSIAYCGHTNPPPQFPVRVVGGRPIELVVGDDVEKAEREGLLGRMLLRLQVSNLDFLQLTEMNLKNAVLSDERIAIRINGSRIPDKDIERVDKDTFVALVTAPPLKRGINRIVVLPGPNSVGALSATVDAVELSVDYKPLAPEPPPSPAPAAPRPDLVLSPVTPMPLSLFDVPVGTSKTLSFDLTADPNTVNKARLALNAEDFDEPAELTITLNGQPLTIPESLLAPSGDLP